MTQAKNILKFLCKLEGYKTAIKNAHFSASNMSEHKLFDDIYKTIADSQDEIGEICQGIYGQFSKGSIKSEKYKLSSSKKFLSDITAETSSFHKSLKGQSLVGLKSVVENLLAAMNKYSYLLKLCLKEDFKRNYRRKLNEDFETDDGIISDAVSAIEMSDGNIEFNEWADAYRDEDIDYLIGVWNDACDESGYEYLKENTVSITGKELVETINEAVSNVIGRILRR